MPPTTRRHRETIDALKTILRECILHPEKKKEFVDEDSIELVISLCDIRNIPWSLATYCAATLRILAHGNDKVKARIVAHGGLIPLLELCDPDVTSNATAADSGVDDKAEWRFRAHEQTAAVLQILSYQNSACQAEMVSAGAIKHLVQLCDIFNVHGCHSNCCLVTSQYSQKVNNLLCDMTYGKKLVGKVKEMSQEAIRTEGTQLMTSGNVSGFIEIRKMCSIDLYDTTTDKDLRISDELIKSMLVWPDMSVSSSESCEEEGKYIKLKSAQDERENYVWADISVTEVIDACHFWAHIGGEQLKKKITEISTLLLSSLAQGCNVMNTIPEPGTFVCVSEYIAGHQDVYRAQILETELSTDGRVMAKVFAVDYGFTTVVSGNCLHGLPEDLIDIPSQATICCLQGVHAPPKSAEVLEHAAGALRNLSQENSSYRLYIAAQEGLEALIKLSTVPNKEVCKQAVGALLNLAFNFKVKARIGFLGGIPALLDVCERFKDDEEILLLAVGAIQNLVQDSYVNRCRLADSYGLVILTQIYHSFDSEAVQTKCLHAIKNLVGSYVTSLATQLQVGKVFNRSAASSSFQYDTRSVMDEIPLRPFSMAVSDDDGPVFKETRRRRKRRLRRGEVEPKPTAVALSPDSIRKSSTGESDGCYNNSASFDDTDGETDGERLVQNKQLATCTDNTDISNDKFYIQGYHVPFSEDDLHDFRPQSHIHNISTRPVERSLCAFLNSGKCGTVYLGLRRDGVVAGIKISRRERDLLRLGVDEAMDRFHPSVKHHCYQVDFIPVVRQTGSDSPSTRKQVEDRFVVEIKILSCPGLIYSTREGKTFFRQKSRNEELTTQEVREKTIKEQEELYNSEMQTLRFELEELKRQLHEKTTGLEKQPQKSVQGRSKEGAAGGNFVINGEHKARNQIHEMTSFQAYPLTESQDEPQNANCVIS